MKEFSLILIYFAVFANSNVVVPKVKFSNGNEVPIVGLGTWQSKPGDITQAIKDAIDIGYRHFDCAHVYENEKEIGDALKAKFDDGTVKREDIFITSKLWNNCHRPDLVEGCLRSTLKNLTLDYVDLYLIHWPTGIKEGDDLCPKDKHDNIIFSDVDYVDTWKAMEEVQKKGLAKSIGLSNFNNKQIDRILEIATVQPVNNQVQCHSYLNLRKLVDYCKSKGITVTAYSPLGSPGRPLTANETNQPKLSDDTKLKEIADKYSKTVAQVLIRYHIQRGVIVIPKSTTKSRLQENFNVFDFQLSAEDMSFIFIDSLHRYLRYIYFPAAHGHKYHPFEQNDEF